ncbi:MAG: helix-turn-helix transcriptional regulator [Pyrinomonadaceae bacterium]
MKPTTFDQPTDGRVAAASSAASSPPATSFGEQLRRAREARGIPLREIADQTRISIRYLEGIEANDYKQLPGGIFNRSFIKAYARYIGFNEKEALEAYTHTAREQGELPDESGPILQTSRVYLNEQHGRSPLLTAFLTILVLAILSLGVYAALRGYQRRVGSEEAALQQNNQLVGVAAPATVPTAAVAQPAPAASFKVEVTALGEDVWMRVRSDQESGADVTLRADTSREFSPAERLTLQYSKSRAKSIQVKVNGQPATVPIEGKGSLAEMVINRGDSASVSQ